MYIGRYKLNQILIYFKILSTIGFDNFTFYVSIVPELLQTICKKHDVMGWS